MSLADRETSPTAPRDSPAGHVRAPETADEHAVSGSDPSPTASGPADGDSAPDRPDAQATDQDAVAPVGAEQPPAPDTEPRHEPGDAEPDELTQALAQRDEYLALAQRTQADFENYRKRMSREAGAAEGRGVARLVKELLPALDNLERALSAAAEDDPLLAGVRLVHTDLTGTLARQGVESYSPQGERFDPAEHEAMAQQPVPGAEPGTVVEVYQPGYRLNGTILRPARVVVAA